MLLENLGQLVLWLLVLVAALNLTFLIFILRRRVVRKRFFEKKDAARESFGKTIQDFAAGCKTPEDTLNVLRGAQTPGAREAVAELLFAAMTPENADRVSEMFLQTGFVKEWAASAFGKRYARALIKTVSAGNSELNSKTWFPALRWLFRMRFLAVPRALSVNNLGRLSPRYACPFLSAALGDPSPEVRRVAVEGLGRARNSATIPLLVNELQRAVTDGSDLSLRSLKVALVSFRLEDLEAFLPYLSDRHRNCRFLIVDSIRQICDRAAAVSPLDRKDFSPALYEAVITKCQNDEFEDVRARAAYIAKHFRDDAAVQMLRNLMHDANEYVRLHTVRAAADPHYKELIPDVVARLTDQRWLVREAAVQTLRTLGDEGHEALYRFFIACADVYAAEQACEELQRRGVIPELVATIARGGEPAKVAQAVATKIASMGKISLLLGEFGRTESPEAQAALMDILSVAPNEEYFSILSRLSQQQSTAVSLKARQLIGQLQSQGELVSRDTKRKGQASGA